MALRALWYILVQAELEQTIRYSIASALFWMKLYDPDYCVPFTYSTLFLKSYSTWSKVLSSLDNNQGVTRNLELVSLFLRLMERCQIFCYLCQIFCSTNIFCYFCHVYCSMNIFCYFFHVFCYICHVFCLLTFFATFVMFFNNNNIASFRTFDRCLR